MISFYFAFAKRGSKGVFTLLTGWIGIIITNYSGLIPFQWPYGAAIPALLISMGCDFFLNVALLVGCLAVSPLFMGVGSLLTLPLSVLVQFLVSGTNQSDPWTITGKINSPS